MIDCSLIVTAISVIGTVANIYQKRWCFVVWLFTNAYWCVYDFMLGLYGQSILFFVYFLLAIAGLARWQKQYK